MWSCSFYRTLLSLGLILFILAGCTQESADIARQNVLNAQLLTTRQFAQQPPTMSDPAQFSVCGDETYPCPVITPRYFVAPPSTD